MPIAGVLAVLASVSARGGVRPVRRPQIRLARVERMPSLPQPYRLRDWGKVARDYDAFVFNFKARGDHLPLIWWDRTTHNFGLVGFGLPSYVGTPYQRRDNQHEAINCIAAIVGASLVGIDKSDQDGHNFALMCQKYFSKDNGLRLYLNGTVHGTGGSFWYETYPSILFAHLLALYPNTGDMAKHLPIVADRMHQAILKLGGDKGLPNFDHTAFNYRTMAPVDNGRWKEPDAAAGYAWLQYVAYVKTHSPKYLHGADLCMRFLEQRKANPFYEVLMPYGAALAARMNAELGRRYDVGKLLAWSSGPSVARPGWGVIADRWGSVDVAGLSGSLTDGGGYAFAMNTFDQAAALAPLPRYDERYARAIGKYLLNLANAARLFYPNAHTDDHQNCAAWARKHDPNSCIAYEGCRKLGRRSLKADADFKTLSGRIVAGDYRATRVRRELPRAYEVLEETIVGDHDRLEHIWTVPLLPGTRRYVHADARRRDAGDADDGFRFSYATKPDGPYRPMFTVKATGRDKLHWFGLPPDLSGTLYVKAEDTDRTPGQKTPDRLFVDSLFIMYQFDTHSPFGMGDGGVGGRPGPVATDFGLYGSSHVGYLGGIVQTTNVAKILQWDLLKTDWHHGRAYPSRLLFNPHDEAKDVRIDAGPKPADVYDTVSKAFLSRNVRGATSLRLAADTAAVLVLTPAGGKIAHDGRKMLVDGVVVDYHAASRSGQ